MKDESSYDNYVWVHTPEIEEYLKSLENEDEDDRESVLEWQGKGWLWE